MKDADQLFMEGLRANAVLPPVPYIRPTVYLTDIEPRKVISGFGTKDLRGFLRGLFGKTDVAEIDIDSNNKSWRSIPHPDYIYNPEKALRVCEQEGFCVVDWNVFPNLPFKLTEKGNLFVNSSTGNIARKTIIKNLLYVLEQARAYNQNPEALFRLSRLTIFGSFLTSTLEKVGDLDILYRWEVIDSERYRRITDARQEVWEKAHPHRDPLFHYSRNRAEWRLFLPRRPNHFNFCEEQMCHLNFYEIPYLIIFENRPKKIFNYFWTDDFLKD